MRSWISIIIGVVDRRGRRSRTILLFVALMASTPISTVKKQKKRQFFATSDYVIAFADHHDVWIWRFLCWHIVTDRTRHDHLVSFPDPRVRSGKETVDHFTPCACARGKNCMRARCALMSRVPTNLIATRTIKSLGTRLATSLTSPA